MRRALLAGLAATVVLALPGAGGTHASQTAPIKRVFIVVLENKDAAETFGPKSQAPYLARKLRSKGVFLPNYFAIGHASLTNYIAMISGQTPNPATQKNCATRTLFAPATPALDGQFQGTGCVYPANVPTLAGQLEASGRAWRGYLEDMGTPCRRPVTGGPDNMRTAKPGDQYVVRHNPFVFFRSITSSPTCEANVVDFGTLGTDLARRASTPALSYIVPNVCSDGHDAPCVDGRPGGLRTAGEWLARQIPLILRSPGFRDHGLLVVTFDEAEKEGKGGDSRACCGELTGPNVRLPGITGPGGGRTGAVLVSPCIEPGTRDRTPYNHYSLLSSVEKIFGLPLLGYAAQPGLSSFGRKVFTDSGSPGCR